MPSDTSPRTRIAAPSDAAYAAARQLSDGQAKPLGALGDLESLAAWVASCQGTCPPRQLDDVRVVVFAGDHGIATDGVSAYPVEITPAMVYGIAGGHAGVSALAAANNVAVSIYDLGVAVDFPDLPAEVSRFKVRHSSGAIHLEDALTRAQVEDALAAGDTIAAEQVAGGAQLLISGDLGIGNTTIAAALIAATLGVPPAAVTGRGTGIDDSTLIHKTALIEAALSRAGDRVSDPVERLAALGAADFAAAVGFISGAARRGVPVLLDGVIAVAEALVAEDYAPGTKAWLQAGHRSTEPGQALALDRLGLKPLVDFSMRLGEGSGAVLAVPMVRSAVAALTGIAQLSDLT
ncbi:nicotinate-nucleotide--dimethylbenzimidazole phosphoribosyltransferase [Propionicimonas sp.]|uniref:nicotinate-nucleotide--dimethylbenzimidazole phosphoribosyltransferase n=1 Tax=Propionicimonas sp. TaxID=1955623 RepID=UPI0039E40EFC